MSRPIPESIGDGILLIFILSVFVTYYDVRYRRIPNNFVLAGFFGGLALNAWLGGWHGIGESLLGCSFAFCLMFVVRMYSGATGPGDIKLFAAIGAIIGWRAVLPAFLIVLITGAHRFARAGNVPGLTSAVVACAASNPIPTTPL